MRVEPGDFRMVRWRCRRGMLELDLIFLQYFDRHYRSSSAEAQAVFCQLLSLHDDILNGYFVKQDQKPDDHKQAQLVAKILAQHQA